MWSRSSAVSHRGAEPCDPGRHSRALSAKQISWALCGLVLLVVGVFVTPGAVPVGPVLLTLGGLVLLLGVALPLVNQIEVGAPMLAKVTIVTAGRREQVRESVENWRGLIVACAASLCMNGDSATRAVEASISKALGYWHGTDSAALHRYLLCVLVQQARFEATAHSRPAEEAEPFLLLPLREREVLVLTDRAGLDPASVAAVLGISVTEVTSIRARALDSLGVSGDVP